MASNADDKEADEKQGTTSSNVQIRKRMIRVGVPMFGGMAPVPKFKESSTSEHPHMRVSERLSALDETLPAEERKTIHIQSTPKNPLGECMQGSNTKTALAHTGDKPEDLEADDDSMKDIVLVAAVDFGTTYSGYAFSFKTKPAEYRMNKNWGGPWGQSYKTPTAVLLDSNEKLVAFGYEAEERYNDSLDETESGTKPDYQLYRNFKMLLHKQKISLQTTVKSIAGVECNALTIFSMSLTYLKDHLIKALQVETQSELPANVIQWVITVPAIWSDEAKQFMREAALKAELITDRQSKKLVIAYEPEAAALYCRDLEIHNFSVGSEQGSICFEPGTKYLVIDAGGGTIDITAHELLQNGKVKEIEAASGGAWGGIEVDRNFTQLLSQILGEDFISTFQKDSPRQWLDMMMKFENEKKHVKMDGKSKINMPLGWHLVNAYNKLKNSPDALEQCIKDFKYLPVSFISGSLVFKYDTIASLFTTVTTKIVQHLHQILKRPRLQGCNYFLLVGGFAECHFLQKAIQDEFGSEVPILVPSEAQMAVVKGAVKIGYKKNTIVSRIAKRTYGTSFLIPFGCSSQDPRYLITRGGEQYCKVFDPYFKAGDEIEIGWKKREISKPVEENQSAMKIELYATDREISNDELEYVDSEDFQRIGVIHVSMTDPRGGKNRSVIIEVMCGGTEIEVHATDETSGNEAKTSFSFHHDEDGTIK